MSEKEHNRTSEEAESDPSKSRGVGPEPAKEKRPKTEAGMIEVRLLIDMSTYSGFCLPGAVGMIEKKRARGVGRSSILIPVYFPGASFSIDIRGVDLELVNQDEAVPGAFPVSGKFFLSKNRGRFLRAEILYQFSGSDAQAVYVTKDKKEAYRILENAGILRGGLLDIAIETEEETSSVQEKE